MSGWRNSALRIILKFGILFLAGLATASIRATFHFQDDRFTGMTFLVSAVGLYLVFERVFPSVYGRSGRPADRLWTKRMFYSGGEVAVGMRDVAGAQRWYSEKLGLGYFSTEVEAAEGSMVLGYSGDDPVIYLVQISGDERPNRQPVRTPIMFARKLTEAHDFLSSRGVEVGPIQSDSGGNQFFHFRDLEGNELEVCQQS
jgi:hypothetical protein